MSIDWTGIIIPVLGIIAGCFFSYYLWIINTNYQRKKIAITIKNDILEINEKIRPFEDRELIQQVKSTDEDNTRLLLPFFEKDDLYKTLRTEISVFDNPLAEKINDFYKKIIAAEQYRKLLVEGKSNGVDDQMYNCLAPMGDLVHKEIIPMLDVEIKWSILVPHGNKPRSQLGQTLFSLGKVLAGFGIILLFVIGGSTFISGSNEKLPSSPVFSTGTENAGDSSSYYSSHPYSTITYTYPTTTKPPQDIVLSVGQSATFSNGGGEFVVTLNSVKKERDIAPQGRVYYKLDFKVKNLGSTNPQMFGLSGKIIDSESERYNNIESFVTIYPGQTKSVIYTYDVPENATGLKYCYELPSPSGSQKTTWTLPE